MPTNYRGLNVPTLISKKSPARKVEAQFRLDHWSMNPKNVARLTAYVTPVKSAPKADRPTGAGSRGGSSVKAACWAAAEATATARGIAIRSTEFWPIYKAETAAARAVGTLA